MQRGLIHLSRFTRFTARPIRGAAPSASSWFCSTRSMCALVFHCPIITRSARLSIRNIAQKKKYFLDVFHKSGDAGRNSLFECIYIYSRDLFNRKDTRRGFISVRDTGPGFSSGGYSRVPDRSTGGDGQPPGPDAGTALSDRRGGRLHLGRGRSAGLFKWERRGRNRTPAAGPPDCAGRPGQLHRGRGAAPG